MRFSRLRRYSSGTNSAISGVQVWLAMADAQSANQDRHAALEALCLDAACMSDPDVLGMSRETCMDLALKILDSKMTDEERQTPTVRTITLYEKERERQIKSMIAQAIQASTETGVGRATVQKIIDELNLEIDALVPDVRFLYELVTRMERQRSAESSTPTKKPLDDAEEFMSNTAKLQPGKLVEKITK